MGQFFSRKRPSARETLEKLENELLTIEDRKRLRVQREQFVSNVLLLYLPVSLLIISVAPLCLYPTQSKSKSLFTLSILILCPIIYVGRKMTKMYFNWSLETDESRLRNLHKEKRRILDEVCETENFKVASEILERYDPKRLRKSEKKASEPNHNLLELSKLSASFINSPKQPITSLSSPQLNFSHTIPSPQHNITPMPNIFSNTPAKSSSFIQQPNMNLSMSTQLVEGPRGRPVRSMLAKERTLLDKAVDWVVADGPWNRYALICESCSSHNGMVLEEEFKRLSYRCGYCLNLNFPPAKLRNQISEEPNDKQDEAENQNDKVQEKKDGDNDGNKKEVVSSKKKTGTSESAEEPRGEILDTIEELNAGEYVVKGDESKSYDKNDALKKRKKNSVKEKSKSPTKQNGGTLEDDKNSEDLIDL